MPTLTGTAHWAKVHEAANSPKYPDNYQYSIDIGPLSVDDIAELTAQGLADKIVHDHAKKDYTPCITFKHPPVVWENNPDDPDGDRIEVPFEPRVVDAEMNAIPKSTLIGNGSTVNVCTSHHTPRSTARPRPVSMRFRLLILCSMQGQHQTRWLNLQHSGTRHRSPPSSPGPGVPVIHPHLISDGSFPFRPSD